MYMCFCMDMNKVKYLLLKNIDLGWGCSFCFFQDGMVFNKFGRQFYCVINFFWKILILRLYMLEEGGLEININYYFSWIEFVFGRSIWFCYLKYLLRYNIVEKLRTY